MTDPKSNQVRRDGPRIDLRLRVRYSAADAASDSGGEAEASDVSPKGLRLESDKPVDVGSELKLHVDAGEEEEMQAVGFVTWCKPHTTPTGKTVYDVGVRFESDWLSRDRGPLGSALARIFAMNNFEPARNYERTPVSLRASATDAAGAMDLLVGNLSVGGMQLRATQDLGERVKTGGAVVVEVELGGKVHKMDGRVAWTAAGRANPSEGPRVADSFGVEFKQLPDDDRALLEAIRVGSVEPSRITVLLR